MNYTLPVLAAPGLVSVTLTNPIKAQTNKQWIGRTDEYCLRSRMHNVCYFSENSFLVIAAGNSIYAPTLCNNSVIIIGMIGQGVELLRETHWSTFIHICCYPIYLSLVLNLMSCFQKCLKHKHSRMDHSRGTLMWTFVPHNTMEVHHHTKRWPPNKRSCDRLSSTVWWCANTLGNIHCKHIHCILHVV